VNSATILAAPPKAEHLQNPHRCAALDFKTTM
jgi:hypothetical protein